MAAAASAVVSAAGVLAYVNLEEGSSYYAVALVAGVWRWVAFRTAGDFDHSTLDGTIVRVEGPLTGSQVDGLIEEDSQVFETSGNGPDGTPNFVNEWAKTSA